MLDIELIDIHSDEDLKEFKCEDSLLNEFLKRDAYFEHIMHLSRTKIIKVGEVVTGYFTIEFRSIEIPIDGDDNKYPSIVLKCLAIDENYENKGIGTNVLEYITINSKDISEFIGCRCLFIDARVSKLKWYKDRGFQFVKAEYNDMPIDELIANVNDSTVEMYIDFRDNSDLLEMLVWFGGVFMALINRKGSIILSGKDGTEFSKKMKNPDAEVMEKRDRFLDDARSKMDIIRSKGKTIIRVK